MIINCDLAVKRNKAANSVAVLSTDMKVDFNFMPYLASIYQCTLAKLRATDIDQEVKERAITCM